MMETCGAQTRAGTRCKRRDIYNGGRCKLHGGLSTGPRSAEGRARAMANLRKRWQPSEPLEPHELLLKAKVEQPAYETISRAPAHARHGVRTSAELSEQYAPAREGFGAKCAHAREETADAAVTGSNPSQADFDRYDDAGGYDRYEDL